jgi:REP element-mobilizing transposase RayT
VPRPLRKLAPGGIYHVTARGNRKQRIFLADDDRALFLTLLARITVPLRWRFHAYCLMENHYHLVTETPEANLSAGLQMVNGRYAQAFNARYALTGHLFQGRFHSIAVESDGHLLELSRYLALNPVRAGLCARPEDWPWSSYRAALGIAGPPAFLRMERVLDCFGLQAEQQRENFRRFIRQASGIGPTDLAA